VCCVCDAEYNIETPEENTTGSYCPFCGSLLFEEDEIEELETDEENDGW
jgi:hypothetical protein